MLALELRYIFNKVSMKYKPNSSSERSILSYYGESYMWKVLTHKMKI